MKRYIEGGTGLIDLWTASKRDQTGASTAG